jgi:hypothetical protein
LGSTRRKEKQGKEAQSDENLHEKTPPSWIRRVRLLISPWQESTASSHLYYSTRASSLQQAGRGGKENEAQN